MTDKIIITLARAALVGPIEPQSYTCSCGLTLPVTDALAHILIDCPGPTPPALSPVELWCEGSAQSPVIKNGKPTCKVCGQVFKWQQMIDQIKHVPEH